MSILFEILGYLAGVCTAIAFLPQVIQTIKDRNVSGLSLTSYIIYCSGVVSWILYGYYLHSLQMIVFNSVSLLFSSIVLVLIIKNRLNK